MATYKVIQDIEAEDKLVGPLTLRQFIYAGIAAICLYLSFLCVTKGAAFMVAVFLPIAGATGFFAFPWGKDQPTEVWALAKLRFLLKPRRRIWDQSGAKDLVTITVPKKVERQLTNGLGLDEVQSRLNALANTIDSRGWAVKNVNLNAANAAQPVDDSDRLVAASSLPQEVSAVEIGAADDMLDEAANPIAQQFDTMINQAEATHRQQLLAQMQQPTAATPVAAPPQDWFMRPSAAQTAAGTAPLAAPSEEEAAIVERLKAANRGASLANGRLKTLPTPEESAAEEATRQAVEVARQKAPVTPVKQAAIMELAQNNDLDVATIARQAHKQADDGEVVISLR